MQTITATILHERLNKKEIILIDVRAPNEYQREHIAGSYLIPLDVLSPDKLPATDKPVVLQCLAGKRSADAYQKLHTAMPNLELYSLEGGLHAWKAAGFSVQGSGQPRLPLEQQTQVIIGAITCLGTVLGSSVSSIFFLLPFITGLGLMYAGFSGWCGLRETLAKMPWNQ